jgi:hypothetical protein
LAVGIGQQRRQLRRQLSDPIRIGADGRFDVQRMRAMAQEPYGGTLDQAAAFGEQKRLQRRRHLGVQGLDGDE